MAAARRGAEHVLWRPSAGAEVRRYALAAAVVVAVGGATFAWLGRAPLGPPAAEADDAVLVDLPPELTSAAPSREAPDGPEQDASQAAVAAPPAAAVVPKPEAPKPPDTPPPPAPTPAAESMPKPEPPKPEPPKPPEKQAAPPAEAAPAQEAMAPAGTDAPTKDAEPVESEVSRRRAAAAISRWQRALMGRLEIARRGIRPDGVYGRVDIAFSIDSKGRLVADHVAHTSGSPRLDRVALAVVEHAAPFPEPPSPTDAAALSFTVPIVFAHR